MADFITLSCSSCGGKLQITNDVERFACSYCGNEQIVKRGGGIVSLAPVMEGMQKVQASTDRVGAELAIQRLTADLTEAQTKKVDAEARLKVARQKEFQASGPGVWAIFAALSILGLVVFGLFTVLALATGTAPGILLGLTIFFAFAAVASVAIAFMRNKTKSFLRKARETNESEIAIIGDTVDRLTRERDQQRALVH